MSQNDERRRRLVTRLCRGVAYTAPALALVGGAATLQTLAEADSLETGFAETEETLLLVASQQDESAEAEGEAEAKGEAEAEAEGEAEAEAGDKDLVKRPEDYEPGYSETGSNPAELLERGEELYYDTSLSTNGLSCASCHGSDGNDMGYEATFEQPFPHEVAMASSQFDMPEVHADEMVQVCMVAPMEAEPLDWGGEPLMSLSAYMVEVQRRFAGEPHDL